MESLRSCDRWQMNTALFRRWLFANQRGGGNSSSQRQTDCTLDSLMELKINGRPISVRFKSDAVVAQRVAAHIQRRIEEDDWLPFQSKEDALQSWQKLGGIRVQVLRAYDLI